MGGAGAPGRRGARPPSWSRRLAAEARDGPRRGDRRRSAAAVSRRAPARRRARRARAAAAGTAPTTAAATAAATVATRKAALAPQTSTILPATEAPTATPSPSAVPIQVNASVTAARGTSSSARVKELIRDGDTATPASTTNGTISQTSRTSTSGTVSTVSSDQHAGQPVAQRQPPVHRAPADAAGHRARPPARR